MRELSEDYGEAPCDYDRNYPRSPSEKARGWIWALIVSLMLWGIIGWFFLWMTAAHAHSWFTGERDPVTNGLCCDNRDCMEIADTDVMSVAGGFIYLPIDNKTGPVDTNPGFIPSARVKSSKSFGYAICLGGGQYSTGSTSTTAPMFIRCFFAPSGF